MFTARKSSVCLLCDLSRTQKFAPSFVRLQSSLRQKSKRTPRRTDGGSSRGNGFNDAGRDRPTTWQRPASVSRQRSVSKSSKFGNPRLNELVDADRIRTPSKTGKGLASRGSGRNQGKPRASSRNSPFAATNLRKFEPPPTSGRREATLEQKKDGKSRREKLPVNKALKMQQTLAQVSYKQRNKIKDNISANAEFDGFGLLPTIQTAMAEDVLGEMKDVSPTPIQSLAIPALMNPVTRKSSSAQHLLAAETGSGKTLAYLLPMLDAIKRAEIEEKEQEAQRVAALEKEEQNSPFKDPHAVEAPSLTSSNESTAARPKAIILLPTSELVSQVGKVVKAFSHKVKIRSAMISANDSATVIRNRTFASGGIDILVSTPFLLSNLAAAAPNLLSRVTHLIIDEADTLFDKSFAEPVSAVIDRSAPSVKQLILCSATIPQSLDRLLQKRFPDMQRLVTPNLHTISRRVPLTALDIRGRPYQNDRLLACADTIWNIGKEMTSRAMDGEASGGRTGRLIVFVDKREECAEVATYLQKKGIDAVALNRDETSSRQSEILDEFTSRSRPSLSSTASETTSESPKIAQDQAASTSTDLQDLVEQSNDEPPKAETNISWSPPGIETPTHSTTPTTTTTNKPPPSSTKNAPKVFTTTLNDPSDSKFPSLSKQKRTLPNMKVLVATDLIARGIDTVGLKCVILYRPPKDTISYIHRLGRVGRLGSRGRAIVIVGSGDRFDVVKEVRVSMFAGKALI